MIVGYTDQSEEYVVKFGGLSGSLAFQNSESDTVTQGGIGYHDNFLVLAGSEYLKILDLLGSKTRRLAF